MLHAPDKQKVEVSSITHIIQTLSDKDLFDNISYDQYLRLAARKEKISLLLVSDPAVQNSADGLVISVLGSVHGVVASKILSTSILRDKLLGIDLEKLASSSKEIAIEILTALDLKSRLKTYDIAAIGAEHPDLVDMIITDLSLFGKIEYIHYGELCQNNLSSAKRVISEKTSYMEVALIAKHHLALALALVSNTALRNKLDTESLVILSSAGEAVAIAILEDPGFYEQLGPIGVARVLARYNDLAHDFIAKNPKILYEFDKISTVCIVANSPSTALQLYNNREYRSRTQIDNHHIAWIEDVMALDTKTFLSGVKAPSKALLGTFEKVCVSFMLKNKIAFPNNLTASILKGIVVPMLMQMVPAARRQIVHQLVAQVQRMEIDEVVALGHKSVEVADDVLLHYKARLVGGDLVLLGEQSFSIVEKILQDPELCGKLSGFNLVMMCKNHPDACKRILLDKELREKIVGCHAGVLALKDPSLLHLIFGDELIKANLTQKDLPLLCKRYIGVTKQALADKDLQSRFSKFYCELLNQRMFVVGTISKCIKKMVASESRDEVSSYEEVISTGKQELLLTKGIRQQDLDLSSPADAEKRNDKLLNKC
jgi:hypothetical protein